MTPLSRLLIVLLTATVCATCTTPSPPPQPIPYTTGDLTPLLGRRIQLVGTAESLKYSAAVMVADSPVYIDGLTDWPKAYRGRKLKVVGTVARIPPAPPGYGGIPDGAFLLRDATWELMQD
jgi:hypothetical protein